MQFFVKTLSGKTITIEAEYDNSIKIFKQYIEDKIGMSSLEQRLIWMGKELENERTISDYNIEKETTIYLSQRLRGC